MKLFSSQLTYIINQPLGRLFLITTLFSLKAYAIYRLEFSLGVQGALQQILLLVNPAGTALLFLAFALFFKEKKQLGAYLFILFALSFILYINLLYYRFFHDFITAASYLQTQNFGHLGGSTIALMNPYDFIYFLDVIVLALLVWNKTLKPQPKASRKKIATVFLAAAGAFSVNLTLALWDDPQLLTKTFNRHSLVKYVGVHHFTVIDTIQTMHASSLRSFAREEDLQRVENYLEPFYVPPNPEFFGIAQNMNVMYISLESLQSFVIDYKMNGEYVMPFLHSLAGNQNTLYFEHFFHQTAQGKTSDAEFLMENSFFPLPKGSAYVTKTENTYESLPAILKKHGFQTTAVFHGNDKTFWNREEMYETLGYDRFYHEGHYTINDETTVNYGLKDKIFFDESIPYLKQLPQPFYAKFLTLSNHFPYALDKQDATIDQANTSSDIVNQYIQTARYTDEALQQFFRHLQKNGLYENTMFVLYGDHYGLSQNYAPAMEQLLGENMTQFKQQQLLHRVPLLIHIPGGRISGGLVETYGGQADVRPTVLRLLGIETKPYIEFGTDLLAPARPQIVPLRNGDFIAPDLASISGRLFDNPSGKRISSHPMEWQYRQFVNNHLYFSDQVVYGDLLRFQQLP